MADTLEDFFNKDVFDSRDVQARIDELEADIETRKEQIEAALKDWVDNAHPQEPMPPHEQDDDELQEWVTELTALQEFKDEVSEYSREWSFGMTFIADSYFTEYAKEMAYDIGAVDENATWPVNHIDWDAAADELKTDYTSVELDEKMFWYR